MNAKLIALHHLKPALHDLQHFADAEIVLAHDMVVPSSAGHTRTVQGVCLGFGARMKGIEVTRQRTGDGTDVVRSDERSLSVLVGSVTVVDQIIRNGGE